MKITISAQEVWNTLDTARSGSVDEAVEAFKKLGMLKCREAGPALIARITDKAPQIRLVCVQESVDILGEASLKHLVARLQDNVIQIAMNAASALAYLGTSKAAGALIQAANSADPIMQTHGAYALGFWDSRDGAEVLRETVLDPDFDYRGLAALALGRIGGKEIPRELLRGFARATDEEEKIQIAAALTMLGDNRREVIVEGLQSQWPNIKLVALSCVTALKDKSAFLDIIPLLKDADANVAMAAADTLEAVGVTQKERKLVSKNELAKYAIRKFLPEGYQLDADE